MVRKYGRAVGAIRSLRSRGNKVSAESPAQLLPDAETTCPLQGVRAWAAHQQLDRLSGPVLCSVIT
jgi:hypothetical protein